MVRASQVLPEAPGRGAGGAEEGCSPPSQRKLQLQRAGVSSPSPALLRPGRGAVGTPPPFQGPADFVKATSHLGEVPQLVQGHTARRAGPVVTDQIRCSRPPGAQPSPHHGRLPTGSRLPGGASAGPSPAQWACGQQSPAPAGWGWRGAGVGWAEQLLPRFPGGPPPGFRDARQTPWVEGLPRGRGAGGLCCSVFLF